MRDRGASTWIEIVGVAKTAKYLWLGEPPTEFVYLPYRQHARSEMVLLTESAGDPTSLVAPLRELVQGFDRTMPIYNVRTMDEFYQMRTITIFNVIIGIVFAMGMMGLVLAIVGLYGLMAYATSRRTREIGIRMAIGAGSTTVLRMVLRQGLVLAVAGLIVGLLAGAGAEQLLQSAFPSGERRVELMASPGGRADCARRHVHRHVSAGAPRRQARSDEGAAIRVATLLGFAHARDVARTHGSQGPRRLCGPSRRTGHD